MTPQNVLIVGHGSIGVRHGEVLKSLGIKVSFLSRRSLHEEGTTFYTSLNEGLERENPDMVVIANETSEHVSTLQILVAQGFSGIVLVEKPLAKSSSSFLDAVGKTEFSRRLFVGYNLRHHPVVLELKQASQKSRLISAWMYCGQYLPNWRSNRPYQDSYSSTKVGGGGVLRDLSHEIDLIHWLFPQMELKYSDGGHWSCLESDSDDHFNLLFSGSSSSLGLHLNSIDPQMQRKWIFNFEHDTLSIDLNAGTVACSDGIKSFEIHRNDTYVEMHKALIYKQTQNICHFHEGIKVLETIEKAEAMAQSGSKL